MKKLLAILMCVVMLTCGVASVAAAEDKTTVNLWYYWENLSHQAELDKIIQGYNGSQEKVEVVASYIPIQHLICFTLYIGTHLRPDR